MDGKIIYARTIVPFIILPSMNPATQIADALRPNRFKIDLKLVLPVHFQLSSSPRTDIFTNSKGEQFLLSHFYNPFDHLGAVPVLRSAKAVCRYRRT